MRIITAPQGSDEWRAARLGHPTASQFDRIITPGTMRYAGAVRRYQAELILERLYRQPWENLERPTAAMQEGIENEPRAAEQFTIDTGMRLTTVGHIMDDLGRWGCSPDRIVAGKHQAVEIKCSKPPQQIENMLFGPDKYRAQLQGTLFIGGFECIHFYSYHKDFASRPLKVDPDRQFLNKLSEYLHTFVEELDRYERIVRDLGFLPDLLAKALAEPVEEASDE